MSPDRDDPKHHKVHPLSSPEYCYAFVCFEENEEEPSFSDEEGFVDNISNDELCPEVVRQEPNIDLYESCCSILFGLPIVEASRLPKLTAVINKIISNTDRSAKLKVLQNEDGSSKGCAFIEWSDKSVAEFAKTALDGYRLDKNHTFNIINFDELKKVQQPPEDWQTPEPRPYVNVGDLWSWMQNSRCRDQFTVLYEKNGNSTVGVYWNVKGHDPELVSTNDPSGVAERTNWTETVFKWSPYGSYLSTIHARGIMLWGGPEFEKCQRFAHDGVEFIQFSPCETYLVTYAAAGSHQRWGEDENCLRIWDVRTGELKKGFSLYSLTNRNEMHGWPFFQWSHDEKYFACLKAPEKDKLEREKKVNGISVFSSETFELVDKKSVTIENIKTFQWSPTANTIAYYSECTDTLPAEFAMMHIPSQEKLRSGRFYNVAEAQMYWQKSGRRLAVYTMRYNKKQIRDGEVKYVGGCTYHLEVFDIQKKDVELMTLHLPEPFVNFGWEPNGDKFCVLIGNSLKVTPCVYKVEPDSATPLRLVSKLDPGVQFNEVQWAPAGGWLAVLSLMSAGGNIVFVDTTLPESKRTNVCEHPGFNKGYWDPTGRYFVSCSTVGGKAGADLGFRLYTFQGRELCRKGLERLAQFQWRPRPPVKLTEQKHKEIKKNLKKTSTRFVREDNEEKYKASQEVVEKRRKIMSAFDIIRKRNHEYIASLKEEKIELRGLDSEAPIDAKDLVEEHITIALSTEKTLAPVADMDD